MRPGMITIRVFGKGVEKAFENESGLHQIQRIPPTEKHGRLQTSTITVAVLPELQLHQIRIDERDLEYQTCRGSGSGGQKKNVTSSAVQLTHLPTKLMVRCEAERSQKQNKELALQILASKLQAAESEKQVSEYNAQRRNQIGSGRRGDTKVRTLRFQDDLVINHLNGKRTTIKKYLKGDLAELF